MSLRLFNSMTRQLEPFAPAREGEVSMYCCGPTVYNYIHIGNARPAVVFGLLARLLRRLYPKVTYARNITDVDDKINKAALDLGVPIETITNKYADAYHQDLARLGVDRPDIVPHATHHISDIITMCEDLIRKGHAYEAEGHVLFAVATYPQYGELSRRSTDEMLAGARVEVAPYKRDPGDFVLWKPSTPELPGWDSPWGRGRPGWHIECSAMCKAHFGETIDIHAGGIDLQFPHHENEVAQSTCAHDGRVFARFWLHNGMLNMDGRKMSKSLGNVFLLHDLLDAHPPEALRYALLSAQYRQPLDWSDNLLDQAARTLDRWYGGLRDVADIDVVPGEEDVPESVLSPLLDDLNTPEALAAISELAAQLRKAESVDERRRAKARLLASAQFLGLLMQSPADWFARSLDSSGLDASAIDALVNERTDAKKARDFARADGIRKQLADAGIELEDTPQGTRWKAIGK
ncbi:MAG: cysteine--tRNA ligase [Ahniella sp.]|nr:cysteine--tRNA ligase [Ahniella sp.]